MFPRPVGLALTRFWRGFREGGPSLFRLLIVDLVDSEPLLRLFRITA